MCETFWTMENFYSSTDDDDDEKIEKIDVSFLRRGITHPLLV